MCVYCNHLFPIYSKEDQSTESGLDETLVFAFSKHDKAGKIMIDVRAGLPTEVHNFLL